MSGFGQEGTRHDAVCPCGHKGKSHSPDWYRCSFCYYSTRSHSNKEKSRKLRARADKLDLEAAKFWKKAWSFKAKHSDVGSVS